MIGYCLNWEVKERLKGRWNQKLRNRNQLFYNFVVLEEKGSKLKTSVVAHNWSAMVKR